MRISDWSSDVCSSDLIGLAVLGVVLAGPPTDVGVHLESDDVVRASVAAAAGLLLVGVVATATALGIDRQGRLSRRSEESRVGKECGSTCRYRWCPCQYKTTQEQEKNAMRQHRA